MTRPLIHEYAFRIDGRKLDRDAFELGVREAVEAVWTRLEKERIDPRRNYTVQLYGFGEPMDGE